MIYNNISEKIATLVALSIEMMGALLIMKFLSINLDKNTYGEYLLLVSLMTVVIAISYSAIDQGFLRKIEEYRLDNVLHKKFSGVAYSYLCGLLLMLVIYSICSLLIRDFNFIKYLWLLMWIGLRGIANLQLILINGMRDRWIDVESKIIEFIVKFSILFYANEIKKLDVDSVVISQFIAALAQIVFICLRKKKLLVKVKSSEAYLALRESLEFCWPMIIWGGFGWLQAMSARWIIADKLDSAAVAEYYILYSIATLPVTVASNFVTNYIVPIVYQKKTTHYFDQRTYLEKISLGFLIFSTIVAIVIGQYSKELIVWASSRDYLSNGSYVFFIAFSIAMSTSSSVLAYNAFINKKIKILLIPSILPGLVMLIASYFLVESHGLTGVVAALFLSHLAGALLYIYIYKRY